MPDDNSKAPNNAAATTVLMAAIISGAVIIAAVGTFLPDLMGIEGTPAIAVRLVFYAVAAVDVAVALWLRARFARARQASGRSGNTVQPMR